jgi:hypothetical protein
MILWSIHSPQLINQSHSSETQSGLTTEPVPSDEFMQIDARLVDPHVNRCIAYYSSHDAKIQLTPICDSISINKHVFQIFLQKISAFWLSLCHHI